jgi:hypothetical protein
MLKIIIIIFSIIIFLDPIASCSEAAGDQGETGYNPPIEFDPIKAEAAREIYPPDTTRSLLKGDTHAPEGFDSCMKEKVGSTRLSAMRSGAEPSGIENDLAALCLMELEAVPESVTPPNPTGYDPGTLTGALMQAHPDQRVEMARNIYTPSIAEALLVGRAPAPEGFDEYIEKKLGTERFSALRSGASEPTGAEKDQAALCLMELEVPVESLALIYVERVDANYSVANGNLSGWFRNGQEADMMLSGFGFNDSGGPLSFNHPKGIATDGIHLLLADGNNNRVLIWNQLPAKDAPPDLVLGQQDFNSNRPGRGRDQMNWPVSVSTDGRRVVVADTYNDRILIWNRFPSQNGTPADIVLEGNPDSSSYGSGPNKNRFAWPWGVWTDGERLVVTSTQGGYALIWNTFPERDDQPADLYLTAGGDMGTPRTITSDGKRLIIADHNAKNTGQPSGNFFWNAFPTTDDEPYDFFYPDPIDPNIAWMQGKFTSDDELVMLGSTLHLWEEFPNGPEDLPDISISGFRFDGGDGADLTVAGERIYVSLYNGNRVVVYDTIPSDPSDEPDFAIGSPDVYANTLETRYIITNGIPATNGESLFVSSDFDRKLYVWKQIPDESGAYPDLVYDLNEALWDNALWGDRLALAGGKAVFLWRELPLNGEQPSTTIDGGMGGVTFQDLKGVALDDRYLYLSDFNANRVYVWEITPDDGFNADQPPTFSLAVDGPWRLSSDGEFLAVTSIYNHAVYLYRVGDLSSKSKPTTIGGAGTFNLPQNAVLSHGSLFIADTIFNRVFIWKDVASAVSGKEADVVLGKGGVSNPPMIGRDVFFWPAGLAFDGSHLWVGEFKFSYRLLRFSVT